MFNLETVDAILNGSLLVVWAIVFGLGYYYWLRFQVPVYHCFATGSVYTMHWRAGFRKGYIDVIRADDCFSAKLTRGFHCWHFIVPLDIEFEALADFIKHVEVADYYDHTDLDMLQSFQEMVCDPDLIRRGSDDEALIELMNHGLVLKHYPGNGALVI